MRPWVHVGCSAAVAVGVAAFALPSCGLATDPGETHGFGGGGGAGGASGSGGSGGTPGPATGSGGSGGSGKLKCPFDGEFISGINPDGSVLCVASLAPDITRALNNSCSVYLGWHDNCSGCAADPDQYGYASGTEWVSDGVNGDYGGPFTLPPNQVNLAAVRTSGFVDDSDQFYAGLHCKAPASKPPHHAPCTEGELIVGLDHGVPLCASLGDAAVAFARRSCKLYFGWQDQCESCSGPPTSWGFAGDNACHMGNGPNTNCGSHVIDGETVNLFSLNTSGNVDFDDDFYIGLACDQPSAASEESDTCPPGQFASAVTPAGKLACESIAPQIYGAIHDSCAAYLGWQACTGSCPSKPPPTKWGFATPGACTDGTPTMGDLCINPTLDGVSVNLFGVKLEGSSGDPHTLMVGLACY